MFGATFLNYIPGQSLSCSFFLVGFFVVVVVVGLFSEAAVRAAIVWTQIAA